MLSSRVGTYFANEQIDGAKLVCYSHDGLLIREDGLVKPNIGMSSGVLTAPTAFDVRRYQYENLRGARRHGARKNGDGGRLHQRKSPLLQAK